MPEQKQWEKVEHVRRAATGGTGHTCHWPGCEVVVPPAMWGCKPHWFRLPAHLRRQIWATYRPGQEDDRSPSREYVVAARLVKEWIQTKTEVK